MGRIGAIAWTTSSLLERPKAAAKVDAGSARSAAELVPAALGHSVCGCVRWPDDGRDEDGGHMAGWQVSGRLACVVQPRD